MHRPPIEAERLGSERLRISPAFPVLALRGPSGASLFLLLHTLIWTLYAVLSDGGALHRDMLEAYGWGREFQLGYYKHPPFWAWIAGLWFEIFPRANWTFFLLATLNTGLGALGIWYLTGLFTRNDFRIAATILVLLIPFYTLQGHKFNANFILVSLWPWTVYFFVRSMEKRQLRDAVLFGILAAASLLSKYYSVLLLLSCALGSLLHPQRGSYYRSAAPYLAVAICALLVAPHVWWLTQNDFQTLTYVETRTAFGTDTVRKKLLEFTFGSLTFCVAPFAVVFGARMWGGRWSIEADAEPIQRDRAPLAIALGLGPFVLTVLSSILGHVRLSTNFASPIFFLVPLLLIQALKPQPRLAMRAAAWTIACFIAAALVVAPWVPYLESAPRSNRDALQMPEIAKAARRVWLENTGQPLRIAAGTEDYALGVAYYSRENTSAFLAFDKSRAPWITGDFLRKSGFLGICHQPDEGCEARARAFGGIAAKETVLSIPRRGRDDHSEMHFKLFIVPPGAPRVGQGAVH